MKATQSAGMWGVMVLAMGLMGSHANGQLTLPYYGVTSTPEKAFWISNSFSGAGSSYGGFFYSAGEEGRGVFGQSDGINGFGVKGWAKNSGDANNYGGHFCATGMKGIGVYGWADNTGDVENYGGYFLADGDKGIGMYAKGGPRGLAGQFDGDILITGTGHGIVFPDGTKQTTAVSDGMSKGVRCFPKPAYDSGWTAMPYGSLQQTVQKQLPHNLGGNVDDYVVDMQIRYDNIAGWRPPENTGLGTKFFYSGLTASSVTLSGPASLGIDAFTFVRIRIWVYDCTDSTEPTPK